MLDTKELYWAAGFIEGEGCFYGRHRIDSRGYNSLVLTVSAAQVQREPLERLQSVLGGNISPKTVPYKDSRSPYYQWNVNGFRAIQVAMTLYALMSSKRKTQAKKMLDVWKAYSIGRAGKF